MADDPRDFEPFYAWDVPAPCSARCGICRACIEHQVELSIDRSTPRRDS